ncbi:hypothetical protein MHU86_2268 [Fragilaria crotonensis]|nr:hypothetical protein MHU86_2268 [Fragilaria crotonensis]
MTTREKTVKDNDVLCGRGGATNNHVGNKMFRSMVNEHQAEYLAAKKRDKALVSQRIVRLIRQNGGRFLRRTDDGLWTDVGDKKATEKTSQALREGLDVRAYAAGKSPRRNSESSSSSANDNNENAGLPKKRRRTEKTEFDKSPAGVSSVTGEMHTMPDLEEEIPRMMPSFVFQENQPLAPTDCDNVVEI